MSAPDDSQRRVSSRPKRQRSYEDDDSGPDTAKVSAAAAQPSNKKPKLSSHVTESTASALRGRPAAGAAHGAGSAGSVASSSASPNSSTRYGHERGMGSFSHLGGAGALSRGGTSNPHGGDKMEMRKQRNRESAALSRERSRTYIRALEEEIARLQARVVELETENERHTAMAAPVPPRNTGTGAVGGGGAGSGGKQAGQGGHAGASQEVQHAGSGGAGAARVASVTSPVTAPHGSTGAVPPLPPLPHTSTGIPPALLGHPGHSLLPRPTHLEAQGSYGQPSPYYHGAGPGGSSSLLMHRQDSYGYGGPGSLLGGGGGGGGGMPGMGTSPLMQSRGEGSLLGSTGIGASLGVGFGRTTSFQPDFSTPLPRAGSFLPDAPGLARATSFPTDVIVGAVGLPPSVAALAPPGRGSTGKKGPSRTGSYGSTVQQPSDGTGSYIVHAGRRIPSYDRQGEGDGGGTHVMQDGTASVLSHAGEHRVHRNSGSAERGPRSEASWEHSTVSHSAAGSGRGSTGSAGSRSIRHGSEDFSHNVSKSEPAHDASDKESGISDQGAGSSVGGGGGGGGGLYVTVAQGRPAGNGRTGPNARADSPDSNDSVAAQSSNHPLASPARSTASGVERDRDAAMLLAAVSFNESGGKESGQEHHGGGPAR